jgi:hypothetical protein
VAKEDEKDPAPTSASVWRGIARMESEVVDPEEDATEVFRPIAQGRAGRLALALGKRVAPPLPRIGGDDDEDDPPTSQNRFPVSGTSVRPGAEPTREGEGDTTARRRAGFGLHEEGVDIDVGVAKVPVDELRDPADDEVPSSRDGAPAPEPPHDPLATAPFTSSGGEVGPPSSYAPNSNRQPWSPRQARHIDRTTTFLWALLVVLILVLVILVLR